MYKNCETIQVSRFNFQGFGKINMKTLIVLLCLGTFATSQKTVKLRSLKVIANRITLSGFSSGGTFAQQLQFSHAHIIHGIAVFSHTFYRCGAPNGKVDDYDRDCTKLFNLTETQLYDPLRVHDDIKKYRQQNLIDDPASLKDKRLYVFTGLRNILFTPAQSLNILKVYERYIKNPAAIYTRVVDGSLVMPTNNNFGPNCIYPAFTTAFIGDCGFSGAYQALNFLLGPSLVNKEPKAGQRINLQPLQTFDQEEFTKNEKNHSMDTAGYLYIPKQCLNPNSKCLLHFYFHGCLVGREFNGTLHVKYSGFLEVAELNNIIMVFPQAVSSLPENDIGCWDTFGISGPLYATRKGPQIIVVRKMIDRILGSLHTVSTKGGK